MASPSSTGFLKLGLSLLRCVGRARTLRQRARERLQPRPEEVLASIALDAADLTTVIHEQEDRP